MLEHRSLPFDLLLLEKSQAKAYSHVLYLKMSRLHLFDCSVLPQAWIPKQQEHFYTEDDGPQHLLSTLTKLWQVSCLLGQPWDLWSKALSSQSASNTNSRYSCWLAGAILSRGNTLHMWAGCNAHLLTCILEAPTSHGIVVQLKRSLLFVWGRQLTRPIMQMKV